MYSDDSNNVNTEYHMLILNKLDEIDYNITAIKENKIKIAKLQEEILKLRHDVKELTTKKEHYQDAYESQVEKFIEFLIYLIGFEKTTAMTTKYNYENRWDLEPTFLSNLEAEIEEQWTRKTQY